MIDIIYENKEDLCSVYFVQLGVIYNCIEEKISELCENLLFFYSDCKKEYKDEVVLEYLPLKVTNYLYKKPRKKISEKVVYNGSMEIHYNIQKIC